MKKLIIFITLLVIFVCSTIATSNALALDSLGGIEIHGFISQGFLYSDEYNYLAHNSKDGSFEYNEMALSFSKQLSDKLRLSTQLFSHDLGDAGNNKMTLDYAFGDYSWKDWLGVRIGKIRVPFGIWNEIRDYDMLRPWIVLPQNFYGELFRDLFVGLNGVNGYGNSSLGMAGNLDYSFAYGSINSDPDDGGGKAQDNSFGGAFQRESDTEIKDVAVGSLKWNTPVPGLMFGGWYMEFESDTELLFVPAALETNYHLDYSAWGLMTEYNWNNLTVWGEWRRTTYDVNITNITQSTIKSDTYYIGAAYRFSDWFQLGAYYNIDYPNNDDKDGDEKAAGGLPKHMAWQKDLALTLQFDISENWILKVEGHQVDGTARVLAIDNNDSDFSESDWYYGAVKATFYF